MEIPKLVAASLHVFSSVTTRLRPTPAKSHYTFNLRDLSKVFQGMAQCPAASLTKKDQVRVGLVGDVRVTARVRCV
jgi:dynein heavy chain